MKKENIKYSDAVAEIEKILNKINSPEADIDTIGADVKRATDLINLCKTKIRKAEAEIEKALAD